MERVRGEGWLSLWALLPALAIAAAWPASALADLPWLALPLGAAFALAVELAWSRPAAFALAAVMVAAAWILATALTPAAGPALTLVGVVWLGLAGLVRGRYANLPEGGRKVLRHGLGGLVALLVGAAALTALDQGVGDRAAPTELRPSLFIPLDVAPGGERMLLFSLRDVDEPDDEVLSLWSLDLHAGRPTRTYRGFPYFLADWCPAGQSVTFLAAERAYEETEQPFGVAAARWDGRQARQALAPPSDGSTWMYPLWSKQGDLLAAWRLAVTGGDLPRSYIVPAGGGQPREVTVRGCRLALLGAWAAEAEAAYVITEKGLFRVATDGRARRLVPAGEAPLEPFPFVIPAGVSPSGRHLAYLELEFKGGAIDRLHLSVVDQAGRRRRVVTDLYPVALAWSADGSKLVGAQVDRRRRVLLTVWDAATGQLTRFDTKLKAVPSDLPLRLQFAPDGRRLALDGQFVDEEGWDIATVDLAGRTATLLPVVRNHLAQGFRSDGKLVVADLQTVAVVDLDGANLQPIYGAATDDDPAALLALRRTEACRTTEALANCAAALAGLR